VSNTKSNQDAARDAGQFIILSHGFGAYITGFSASHPDEIITGSAEDAIRYTESEARALVDSLGGNSKFGIEEVAPHTSPTQHTAGDRVKAVKGSRRYRGLSGIVTEVHSEARDRRINVKFDDGTAVFKARVSNFTKAEGRAE
jgi:hypothetical protein